MNIHYHPTGILTESRCTLENWGNHSYNHTQDKNPETGKNGIRCYNIFTGLFLSLFGLTCIQWAKNGDFVFLNRRSFKKWKEHRGFEPLSQKEQTAVKANNTYTQSVKSTTAPVNQFTDQIALACGVDFCNAWKGLLSHIPSTEILSFENKGNNRHVLTFKRPLTLWLDSRNKKGESSPKGGTVLLLGHNKKRKLDISLSPQTSTMKILSGLNLWCDTGAFGVRKVDVIDIGLNKDQKVELTAGIKLPILGLQTQTKRSPLDRFSKVWSEATYLRQGEDYKKFQADQASKI